MGGKRKKKTSQPQDVLDSYTQEHLAVMILKETCRQDKTERIPTPGCLQDMVF